MRRLSESNGLLLAGALLAALLAGCGSVAAPGEDAAPESTEAAQASEAVQEGLGAFGDDESDGSADDETDDEAGSGAVSAASALVTVDGRQFDVELHTCMVFEGETLLAGLATERGSEVTGYLDGDSFGFDEGLTGEFRIDIGVTGPFDSSEEFIAIGDSLGGDFDLAMVGEGFVVTGSAWNDDGSDLGQAMIEFRCL